MPTRHGSVPTPPELGLAPQMFIDVKRSEDCGRESNGLVGSRAHSSGRIVGYSSETDPPPRFDTIWHQLEEGQRRYAFDNSGLAKLDFNFDPHRPYQQLLENKWLPILALEAIAAFWCRLSVKCPCSLMLFYLLHPTLPGMIWPGIFGQRLLHLWPISATKRGYTLKSWRPNRGTKPLRPGLLSCLRSERHHQR